MDNVNDILTEIPSLKAEDVEVRDKVIEEVEGAENSSVQDRLKSIMEKLKPKIEEQSQNGNEVKQAVENYEQHSQNVQNTEPNKTVQEAIEDEGGIKVEHKGVMIMFDMAMVTLIQIGCSFAGKSVKREHVRATNPEIARLTEIAEPLLNKWLSNDKMSPEMLAVIGIVAFYGGKTYEAWEKADNIGRAKSNNSDDGETVVKNVGRGSGQLGKKRGPYKKKDDGSLG